MEQEQTPKPSVEYRADVVIDFPKHPDGSYPAGLDQNLVSQMGEKIGQVCRDTFNPRETVEFTVKIIPLDPDSP